MKLVTVIPIARGVFKDTLSYWSSKSIPLGSVAVTSVRNRKINALVVETEDIEEAKGNIKAAPFALKKIGEVRPGMFLPAFVSAAGRSAKYFATPIGGILQTFVPKVAFGVYPTKIRQKSPVLGALSPRLKIEKLAFQSEDDDRMAAYKSLVREEFAKKFSVFICFPTIDDVRRVAASFEKGIKEYTVVLHSALPKKTLVAEWEKAVKEEHPLVILATASFISIPREDIRTIIIEKENSRFYKTIGRPEVDIRKFLEYYAEESGSKLIFGDIFLRPETLYRYHEHELLEFTSVKFRSLSAAEGSVVDMKKYKGSPGNTAEKPEKGGVPVKFTTLSRELKFLIEMNRREHGRMFIVAGRRGIAPTTICNDCGTLIKCEKCGSPFVLHEKKKKRFFLCHKCGNERVIERDGEEKCASCGSWRLAPLGVGIIRVIDEFREEFPGIQIFHVDSDTAKNEKLIRKTISQFYETEGSILIGTEMIIPYLVKPVEASALLGIDSFLTIPDLRINEKIFGMILALRAKTQKTIIIQTQDPEREFFDYALRGDLLSFYRQEIAERKFFGYPPFTVLVKISWNTKRERAEKETSEIVSKIKDYETRGYLTGEENPNGTLRANVLIKVPRDKWVDEVLLSVLKSLPPRYIVSINPESLL